tara:strand:- start:1550 stop:1900 length:351 start_codon:yes stop_codon:yes gene_type:complete
MSVSRYDDRRIITNDMPEYTNSAIFKSRGLIQARQYLTPELSYPSPEDLADIQQHTRTWTVGTKYFNLAHEFYGDPQYWWVIAWFNLQPLESNFRAGDVVIIPTPLESVLSGLGLM